MVKPTGYPEVDLILEKLLPAVQQILGGNLAGVYLFGSLASGDFDRESDVDILFATKEEITPGQFESLKEMHEQIARLDSWCATQLEVSYIPLKALRRYDPADNRHPRLDRGEGESLYQMKHDSDWVVQRHLIREKGIPLFGPPPQSLIDAVSSADLRLAMRPVMDDWLAHVHESPQEIRSRGYQAYIVLTVCRVLYTLTTGEVASKRSAAEWAKQTLPKRWAGLIDRAWAGRQKPGTSPEREELEETFGFIDFALKVPPDL